MDEIEQKHIFSNQDLKKLLIPLMLEQLLNSMMGMVDTVMVSNIGGAAISAVSLVDSVNVLVIQLLSALATGGTIVCAQYLGRKDKVGSNQAARQVLLVTTAISLVMMVFCVLFCHPLLRIVFGKVEQDVMSASVIYFYVTAISFPFIGIYGVGGAFYRAEGNSRYPMMISVISNIMNIAGNALLIFVLHWGVFGAAFSTLLSRIFCAVVVMYSLRKPKQMIVINQYHKIRPDFRLIKKVLAVGIPSGVENGMFQFGKLAIQSSVSTLGTVAIAAQAMTVILENLNGMAAIGIGIGLTTIVGQCIGAGRKEEAVYYIKKLMFYGEIALIASCAFVYVISKPVTIIAGMETESANMCMSMMGWITVIKPIVWCGAFIPAYGLRAAGDVKYTMICSTISMWVFRVTLCRILIGYFGFGPIAVWIGMFVDWGMRSVLFVHRFHGDKWLRHHIV
jgi:putative MATE family efflux protein